MRTLTKLLALALAVPGIASADVVFDFSTLGANNTALPVSVTVNGVKATANMGTLWLRNQPNDHGLGVCSETNCSTGGGDVNELSNQLNAEAILLEKPDGTQWIDLWVSSFDGGGTGGSEEGILSWGDDSSASDGSFHFKYGDFGGGVEVEILAAAILAGLDINAKYLRFTNAGSIGENNDYLVWKGSITESQLIPEPATLLLLGLGFTALALRRRITH